MSADEPLINTLIRMVVPMRREFQRHLDVQRFQQEPAYARQILDEAATTQDPRLKEFANYVARRMQSAGAAPSRAPVPVPAPPPAVPRASATAPSAARNGVATPPPAANAAQGPTAEEAILLARLERYRTGLR
jgi:hypothetical protein